MGCNFRLESKSHARYVGNDLANSSYIFGRRWTDGSIFEPRHSFRFPHKTNIGRTKYVGTLRTVSRKRRILQRYSILSRDLRPDISDNVFHGDRLTHDNLHVISPA